MYVISRKTNRFLKAASIINRFLISTIAPKTRKAINDPNENVLLKEDAMNASTSEQSDRTNARPIITREEDTSFCPIASRVDVLTYVCIAAAIKAPMIKYFPTEKNSSMACRKVPPSFGARCRDDDGGARVHQASKAGYP